MYKTDDDIINRVQEHLAEGLEQYPSHDWFVISANGSMNYNLMANDSDVDTKLLLVPSLNDFVFYNKPISTVHIMENNEHISIKDTRQYFYILRKQSINFVEILFSDYWIANSKYMDIWLTLRANREDIARLDPNRAVKSVVGMAEAVYKNFLASCNNNEPNYKDLMKLARLNYFIRRYVEKQPYLNCIYIKKPFMRNWFLMGKENGWNLSEIELLDKVDELLEGINYCADSFLNSHKDIGKDEVAEQILDDALTELITRKMKEELSE